MEDYIKEGENIGRHLQEDNVTTSQIRKFLSAVNSISNKIQTQDETLSDNLVNEIKYLRIKLAYQAGREDIPWNRKDDKKNFGLHFLYNSLNEKIQNIGNSKFKFEEFNKLIESIVAYHKFYGGK